MALEKPKSTDLINVHKVYAHEEVVSYLKNNEKDFVEGLFHVAKHEGKTQFLYNDVVYNVIRNKDSSYTIEEDPKKKWTSEEFS